jgi:zinc protease
MHTMLRTPRVAPALCLALLAWTSAPAEQLEIPYRKEVLGNGLTVIVHEDHKAPVVAVNVWYHVGSKNERPGRTGFAHLFEHLLFQGSENYNDEYLAAIEKLGATNWNGTTYFDRTNYFETVPKNALDAALWLESDRMGHFLGAISQAKLDEQRGVVENEKRQSENQPYGKVFQLLQPALFPPDHPYSWLTIGSMQDLNAATLDDVKDWFRTYYGPNNAVISIAGDVNTDEVLGKVRLYFGDIAPVPPITRPGVWVPRHGEHRRLSMQDRVAQTRIYKVWTGPSWGSPDAWRLEMAAAILGGDKNSRLYQRLVFRDKLATDVEFAAEGLEIAGISDLEVAVTPGADPARAEAAIDEELRRFLDKGPTAAEVERVRTQHRAAFLRGIEQVGGTNGKAGVLAEGMVYGGSPDYYKRELAAYAAANPQEIRRAAAEWLREGVRTLVVSPYGGLAAATGGADRSRLPEPGPGPLPAFPAIERARLANGLQILLTPRPGTGFVEMQLVIDGGSSADPAASPGTASVAMAMLDEGTEKRTSQQISEELAQLGATLETGARLDTLGVAMAALKDKLAPSMEIFADVVLHPSFPAKDLERVRGLYLAQLASEKTRPTSMALRVLPRLLYGEGNAYAQPLTGTGTEAALKALTRDDLARFYGAWFRPNTASLVVAGDTTMATLRPLVEKLFGAWPRGAVPKKILGQPAPAPSNLLYLVDRPDSDQSVIFAGQTLPPKANPDEFAISALNRILGAQTSSRLSMNLREDKHWSYGAYTFIVDARGARPLLAYAPVQTDKTAEALAEMRAEMRGIATSRPPVAAELARVQQSTVLSLPGRWETSGSVAASLAELVRFGLPEDFWSHYAERTAAVTLPDVQNAARSFIHPDEQIWVVVGDRRKIEPGLAKLPFAGIRLIDADGNPVAR